MEKVDFRMHEDELARVDKLVREDSHFDDRSSALRYLIREGLQRNAIQE